MSDNPLIFYCANHPKVQTSLRCNNCEKPICPKCAVLTPTGYRCKECVRGHQKVFETAQWYDYPLAFIVAGGLSLLGSLVASQLGFLTLFFSPVVGVIAAEIVRLLTRRRRSRLLTQVATIAAALGSLPPLIMLVASGLGYGLFGALWPLLWHGYYTFMVTSTVFYRLGGIKTG
jgi:hypothetical protein